MSVTTLYSFTGADGAYPQAGVTLDAKGDIFGTTSEGGADDAGTVFEIKAGTTTATTLYSFNGIDGAAPVGGATLDANGDIFGTTDGGGADGHGTVFEILAGSTTATTLYSFTDAGTDGANPHAGVTLDAKGDIFGTTMYGGGNNDGTVFEIKAGTTTATTLCSFTGTNGTIPYAGVTLDAKGDIFGTTLEGGTDGEGTVFEILAGTTTVTTLYSFTDTGTDGATPYAGVTLDAEGDIFGTTEDGGSDDDDGTLFEIKAGSTTATTLHSFTGRNGAYPEAGVTLDASGDIFGTTYEGGTPGYGTVFEILAGTTTATTLYNFSGNPGMDPIGGVTLDANGDLFGTTADGGHDGDGTVFEIAQVTCFYPGTLILTPEGPRAVESLAIGDRVVTHDHDVLPVRWIGRNTVSTRFADPLRVLPIRIKAGALDGRLPTRDLLVSPEHALLVEDILIQAGALVNGVSIIRERHVPEAFVYYHVELAAHALILAEGTPAETFVDNVHRMAFDNWAEHEALYGDAPIAEMGYPRAQSYRQVPQAIRTRLTERAEMMHAAPRVQAA